MSRVIDKIIICALAVFAMNYMIHGNAFLVLLYMSIILSALGYYLLSRDIESCRMRPEGTGEYIAFIVQIISVVPAVFNPELIPIIPVAAYDMTRSRNYPGAAVVMAAFLNAIRPGAWRTEALSWTLLVYVLMITILSVILSIKTERNALLLKGYKKIRDDSEEKQRKLNMQNQELIQARDAELHNAQLSERNRIARDIHDNVGHTLSRAILQMGALLAIHKGEPISEELEGVRETLDSAMGSIRSSVHNLHDDSIDVKSSITQLAEPLYNNYNVHLDIDISDDMPRNVKYAVIGITKEAISNIIKHSISSDVDIKLSQHPSMYQLVIQDYMLDDRTRGQAGSSGVKADKAQESVRINATGEAHKKSEAEDTLKDRAEKKENGIGLENIRSRAESVNGTLHISDENGFRIFVSIPRQIS